MARVTTAQRYRTGKNNVEDGCQRVSYSYDTNPYDATFGQNTTERLAAARYLLCAANVTVTEMYAYNPAGEVTTKRVQVAGQNTANFDVGCGLLIFCASFTAPSNASGLRRL